VLRYDRLSGAHLNQETLVRFSAVPMEARTGLIKC
jgi:hypothetical protein